MSFETCTSVESTGQESHKLTRIVTVVAEESLLGSGTGGSEDLTRLSWTKLLAVAHLLMDSYLRSESNHYGLVPAVTNVDSMHSITQDNTAADASLFDQAAFLEARARFTMRPGDADTGGQESKNDSVIRNLHARISESLFAAYGYHIETLVTILDVGRFWALPQGEESVTVSLNEFLSRCSELAPDVPVEEARVALEQLILRPLNLSEFIEHWELERRPVRLMTRPFVEAESDRVYVLPWQCDASRRVFLGYLSQGRLIWADGDATPALRQALDGLRETRNKGLEEAHSCASAMAQHLLRQPDIRVKNDRQTHQAPRLRRQSSTRAVLPPSALNGGHRLNELQDGFQPLVRDDVQQLQGRPSGSRVALLPLAHGRCRRV